MTTSHRKKKRPGPAAGFDNVPKILDEARRAVDELTQGAGGREELTSAAPAPDQAGAAGAPGQARATRAARGKAPRKPKPAPGSSPATRRKPAPTPSPAPPAAHTPAPVESRAVPVAPAPSAERPRAPLRTPDYFGIRIRHRLKGRIRLHIRRMKWNQGLADKMQRGLAGVQGIAQVEASPATGSLLVVFDPQTLAAPGSRRDFAAALEGFFPGLDGDVLLGKFF